MPSGQGRRQGVGQDVVSRDIIEEVLSRIHVEDVIGEFVELRKSGASFKGLCPFHEENTPSFYVHPERGFFYCFGCRKGGDAIRFLQEIEGKSFGEALVELAGRVGVEVPVQDLSGQAPRADDARRERHLKLLEAAAQLYERVLGQHPDASLARDYLEQRAIGEQAVSRFRLGFAPDRWDFLTEHLRSHRISPQDGVDVGLIRPRKQGSGYYDWFRNRIVFPITNPGGKVIGFSGRLLARPGGDQKEEAKYINSQETPYYRKGEVIYGLWQAAQAIRQRGRVYLVEGNFDLVAMSQAGFANVVAPMGTAITAEQIRRLSRFRAELVFVFDGDRAGRAAAVRAFDMVAPVGVPARVAVLPSGEDPDSMLKKQGPESLQIVLDRAQEMGQFVIHHAAQSSGDSPGKKVEVIRELARSLSRVPDPMLRDIYLTHVAREFGIEEAIVRKHVGLGSGTRSSVPAGHQEAPAPADLKVPPEVLELVGALIDFPVLATRNADVLDRLDLGHPWLAKLVFDLRSLDPALAIKNLQGTLTTDAGEPYKRWALERLVRSGYATEQAAQEAFDDCRVRIDRRMFERRLQELEGELRLAIESGDQETFEKLSKEKIRLTRLRVAVGAASGEPAS